jgi:two-component system cell cycle sensor histidine kinase/response regulator CckA
MTVSRYKIFLAAALIALVTWISDAWFDRAAHPHLPVLDLLLFGSTLKGQVERFFHVAIVTACFILAYGIIFWRQRTQEAVWEGERLLAAIFDGVLEGLVIKDDSYTIVRVNPVMNQWFAYALPLEGKKCYEALRGLDHPCEQCPSRQALETGKAANMVVPKPGLGGEPGGWLELHAYPLFDRLTGKTTGVIEFARDITQQKLAEEALRESESRYRLLVNQLPALVIQGYPDWSIDCFDDKIEALTGFSKEDFNSRRVKWCDVIHPDDLDYATRVFIEALKSDKSYVREHRIKTKSGETRWVQCRGQIFCDEQGKVDHISGLTFDITRRKQAEEALRESENRYRLLVSTIPAVVFKGYRDWTIDFVDDKIEELTGYAKEEFDSRRLKWSDIILPEDLAEAQRVFRRALKTNKSYVREYRIRGKDGKIIWIQARGQIICNKHGKVNYISGVFFDITAQKRTEAEVERLASFPQLNPNPVLEVNSAGTLTYVNPATTEVLQRLRVQTDGNLFLPPDLPEILRAARERDELSCYREMRIKDAVFGARIEFIPQYEVARLWVTDITARKQAEEALRRSEKRYRLLAENVTDVIWTVDLDFNLTYVSPSIRLLTGHSVEEYLTLGVEQILSPSSLEIARSRFQEEMALEERRPDPSRATILELELYCKDRSTVWTEVKASFLRDANGRPTGMLGVTRDITVRRKLEEQLQQSQKMEVIGRLAGGVAHDFNNLLTAILGYCELLQGSLRAEDPALQDVAEIKQAGERASHLTRQLLAFSRRQVLQPKSLNLNQVVENLGKMLMRVIGEDIELSILPGSDLGRVMADPGQIEQVILNLTVNARDAMPRGGQLIIKTANVDLDENYAAVHAQVQPGPYVLLSVSDTGCGMDAATRSHIFEPFFTTKETGKGTGLGLSTVYGIIRQSGGYIWVYSEPGQGTTFKIYLPRGAAAAAPLLLEHQTPETSRQGYETILLVEDEGLVRQVARRILKSSGYTVLEARNGKEALHIYEQHPGPIHLMLTDLVMPDLNGRELANQLASRHPEMKVIFMSGYADNGIMDKNLSAPGVVYIQKPFEAHVLTRKVRELLDAPLARVPPPTAPPTPYPPVPEA